MENSDTSFSLKKATALLQSFSGLMKNGCVSLDVYKQRRSSCEGCDQNQVRPKDGKRFCGSCGCGSRDLAALYDPSVELDKDTSPRLWMPTSNCPKGLHSDSEGTKNFSPVGGRMKQLIAFTRTALYEVAGNAKEEEKLEAANITSKMIGDVAESEEEIDALTKELDAEVEEVSKKEEV